MLYYFIKTNKLNNTTNERMQGNSIQRYFRFLGITLLFIYGIVNQSFSQNIYVSRANCIDNNPSATGQSVSCTEPTRFFDLDTAPASRTWNFGDLTTPVTLASPNATHTYGAVGTYQITFTKCTPCIPGVTKIIVVSTFPNQPLFNKKIKTDTTVCNGKLKLDPYASSAVTAGVSFLWFPKGETTPFIEVDSSGCYSVQVTSPEGCSRTAQITVKYCLQQPNKPSKKDVWYFGDKGSLEFTKNPNRPVTPKDTLANDGTLFAKPDSTYGYSTQPTSGNILNSPQAMAMVFGPQGNLLFYSDGKTILTGDNQPVPIATTVPPVLPPTVPTNSILTGDPNTTQSVLIVPKNSCNECPHHQYYVFTRNPTTQILSYSIIDMRYNNKKGAIIEKDIPVYYPASEQIEGIATADEKGFWIITHNSSNTNFVVMKLDSTGLIQKEQALGLPQSSLESKQGYLHFSPKGDKVAIAHSDGTKNFVEIYKFDTSAGQLQPPITINLPDAPPRVYGVAFSGDSQKLYVTLKGDASLGEKSYLYQLNLNLTDATQIANTKILIDASTTASFGALQMDSNNQAIYMAVDGTNEMYSIQYPEALGNATVIGYDKPPLGGTPIAGESKWGLPNVLKAVSKDDNDGMSADYKNTCLNETTVFTTSPVCDPLTNKYVWDFGDGTTQTTSTTTISHKYKKAGSYSIKLTYETYEKTGPNLPIVGQATTFCRDTTITDRIYIRPSPEVHLPDSVYICTDANQKLTLNPNPTGGANFTYLWKPTNETTPTIEISAIAIYMVNVKNDVGCSTNDTTLAKDGCEPIVLIPTSFTPNSDGNNDRLQVISKYVTDFELRIYDRWGEQVFYTNSSLPADNQWDGSYKGYVYAPANYAYVVQYKSEYFPERPMVVKRGGILVIK